MGKGLSLALQRSCRTTSNASRQRMVFLPVIRHAVMETSGNGPGPPAKSNRFHLAGAVAGPDQKPGLERLWSAFSGKAGGVPEGGGQMSKSVPFLLSYEPHELMQLISQMVYPDLQMLRGGAVLFLGLFQGGERL